MSQIEFHDVTKRFDNGAEALRSVSVSFEEGSMTFLTGHSGAGKSTFLRLLLRLGPADARTDPRQRRQHRAAARRTGYRRIGSTWARCFRIIILLAHRTVYDNVAVPLRVMGMPERDVARRARAALSRVGLLEKERLLPRHLSTGEQQRVGIARAVVNRPRVLLADEPTGNLDPELSRDIMRLFEQFQEVGTTVIIASHERALIAAMDKPIVELSHGSLVHGADNDDGEAARASN